MPFGIEGKVTVAFLTEKITLLYHLFYHIFLTILTTFGYG